MKSGLIRQLASNQSFCIYSNVSCHALVSFRREFIKKLNVLKKIKNYSLIFFWECKATDIIY